MNRIRIKYYAAFSLLLISIFIYTYVTATSSEVKQESKADSECFMVLVGKKASVNGKVMLAHNNDLTGKEASFVQIIPGNDKPGDTTISYPTGLKITLSAKTYRILIQRIEKGFDEGDAVAINEFGVAIAGGVELKKDRNNKAINADPLVENGLPGGIRYDILARSRTARECVTKLGSMFTKYGVSYPSGVGIADSNEIWYIECGGGRQWAATRIPDNGYWIQANGYRICEIDTSDKENFLTSPGLLEFCFKNDLWNPDEGTFNFSKAFGEGRKEEDGGLKYDRLRIWRGIDLLSPSLNLESYKVNLPVYPVPDKLISEEDLFNLLRDYFAGTEYDRSLKDPNDNSIRSIATWGGVHSSLIVINLDKPAEYGTILWSAIGSSFINGFIPIPFGVTSVPEKYDEAGENSVFNLMLQLAEQIKNDSSNGWDKVKSTQQTFMKLEIDFIWQTNELIFSGGPDSNNGKKFDELAKQSAQTVLDKVKLIL